MVLEQTWYYCYIVTNKAAVIKLQGYFGSSCKPRHSIVPELASWRLLKVLFYVFKLGWPLMPPDWLVSTSVHKKK